MTKPRRPEISSPFKRAVVTGGAGFIGSHLVDNLMSTGVSVTVLDNLSSGSISNLRAWEEDSQFEFLKVDLESPKPFLSSKVTANILFHLAADPDVRAAESHPERYLESQLRIMGNVLEFCRMNDIQTCVFTSSSTVYGDAVMFPTPETYEPLNPISVYGETKLRCERLLIEAVNRGGPAGLILRYANIVGPRGRHGVIYDLARKLVSNPEELEILGDGTQRKSYLHVSDCVEASILAARSRLASPQRSSVINVGNEDWVDVATIAEVVCRAMGITDVRFLYKPGSSNGRGWKGDVKEMQLDIGRLTRLGWKPRYSSLETVRLTAEATALELRAFSS